MSSTALVGSGSHIVRANIAAAALHTRFASVSQAFHGVICQFEHYGGFCTSPQKGAVGLKSLVCSYSDEQTSEVSCQSNGSERLRRCEKAVMRHLLRHTGESSHDVLSEIRYELLRQLRNMPEIG